METVDSGCGQAESPVEVVGPEYPCPNEMTTPGILLSMLHINRKYSRINLPVWEDFNYHMEYKPILRNGEFALSLANFLLSGFILV